MNIGTRSDAQKVLRADKAWMTRYSDVNDTIGEAWDGLEESWGMTLPNGVSMVGSGAFRRVWTVDGDVAYKVGRYVARDSDNRTEWALYKRYADRMPDGFRLPIMTPFTVQGRFILAVELIRFPRQDCKPFQGVRSHLPFPWYDCDSNNYRTAPDGTTILLDFAC